VGALCTGDAPPGEDGQVGRGACEKGRLRGLQHSAVAGFGRLWCNWLERSRRDDLWDEYGRLSFSHFLRLIFRGARTVEAFDGRDAN
jgi:hypothetical protein